MELDSGWVYTYMISVLSAFRIGAIILKRMYDDQSEMEIQRQKFQVGKALRNIQKTACVVCC